MNKAFDLARRYLGRAIESDQRPGDAHLMLGIVALEEGNTARAEMHWSDALRIARRDNDQELMERVEHARFMFHTPPDLLDVIDRFGPELFMDDPFLDFVDDELDEWW
ncbi:MAG: hypothetical protein U9R72_16885 [Chloroflexota bacterium]|nr:hypothetical protein [Chloroflexota bacterium]